MNAVLQETFQAVHSTKDMHVAALVWREHYSSAVIKQLCWSKQLIACCLTCISRPAVLHLLPLQELA